MFNKSLFKQSCKANGTMWAIITFAICFMLSCVMLIAGGGNIASSKEAIEEAIIQGELKSQTQSRAINYYELSNTMLSTFDDDFKTTYFTTYQALLQQGKTSEEAQQLSIQNAYQDGVTKLQTNIDNYITSLNYEVSSKEGQEIKGAVMYVFNPLQSDGTYMFDSFYTSLNQEAPRYTNLFTNILTSDNTEAREDYCAKNSSIFLAGNMTNDESIQSILNALSSYGVTKDKYVEYGYADFSNVNEIANSSLVNYRANLEYRIENIKDGETVESIKKELSSSLSKSLLASLPDEVSDALEEIGQMDLYGTLVGSIFFKMAGLLLPIIYVIMASNNLIAGQVDSGSMAYVLSTSTKRREVTFTQAMYMISSLFVMFLCTTITSFVCFSIVNVNTGLTYGKLALINLGAFLVMFAMSGICFLASCYFNRSKNSMALGGGLTMFFLVATMLGLFGSPVLPSIIRMKALNIFNYVSLISLFDVVSILDGGTAFIWKLAILLGVGLVCYILGSEKFRKKDLPL